MVSQSTIHFDRLTQENNNNGTVSYAYNDAGLRTNVTGENSVFYRYDNSNRLTNVTQGRFTAREEDGTGLYYYRARYYHSSLGRFVGEDPLENSGGDIDLYAYVANKPTTHSDPGGLRLRVCLTPTWGDFFTHKYLYWDNAPAGFDPRCERQQSSPGGGNKTDSGRGSPEQNRYDVCKDVDDTFAMEIMLCCQKTSNSRPWVPGVTDCHNTADDCLTKYGVTPPNLGPHPRFGGRRGGREDKCTAPTTCNFGP
jgi:RHS repeat-associated protein